MMAVERQRRIVELVNERGSLRVTEISQLFEVTPETARRDLDYLEKERKLQRSHGGAVRLLEEQSDVPYIERESTNATEKMDVAKFAATLVNAGDTIALDASSTAWYLAQILPDIALTILTNSVRVVQELSKNNKMTIISTGGILRPASMSFVGPLAEDTLSKYHVHKAFVSCKGVHLEHGVSESNELQALIKRRMVAMADKVFLLADHTKFGQRDFAQAFSLNAVHGIVTDPDVDHGMAAEFRAAGVDVLHC